MDSIKNVLNSKIINELKKDIYIKYPYGTAGFRYHNTIILNDLAYTVGEIIGFMNRYLGLSFGIMVTASHNPIDDNGVKIVAENGEMIGEETEELITLYCNSKKGFRQFIIDELEGLSTKILRDQKLVTTERLKVVIGADTRPSSIDILEVIEDGLISAFPLIDIDMIGHVSTPIVHYQIMYPNQYMINIPIYFIKWLDDHQCEDTILIDCANGVGGTVLSNMYTYLKHYMNCNIRNIGESLIEKQYLNHQCGSEYVHKERKLPISFISDNDHSYRIAHFDGDADRLIYSMINNETKEYHIIDGDKIGVLFAIFIQQELAILDDFEKDYKTKIGFIQTAYANGASTKFVEEKLNIETRYAATGVKNLHHLAKNYDIGLYFEANGHGTVLFSSDWLFRLEKYYRQLCLCKNNLKDCNFFRKISAINNLYYMSKVINQFAGDAITNLLVVEGIIHKTGITTEEWISLYDETPNELWKVEVTDKSLFKPCDDETRLIEPADFQEQIDGIIDYYNRVNARCFVRPSGTENCVRIYCEADNMDAIKDIKTKINRIFKRFKNQ